jgi:hypothetical protein
VAAKEAELGELRAKHAALTKQYDEAVHRINLAKQVGRGLFHLTSTISQELVLGESGPAQCTQLSVRETAQGCVECMPIAHAALRACRAAPAGP